MKLPGWTSAQMAVGGLRAALIGLAFLIAVSVGVVQSVRLNGFHFWPVSITGWIATAETRAEERDAERAAHQASKDDYRAAQIEAARREAARLASVRAQQEEITDAIEVDYRADLAALGARAERLRQELRTRAEPARAGGDLAMSRPGSAAEGIARAPGDRGFPASGDGRRGAEPGQDARAGGAFGRSDEEQLERDIVATRQALQLEALIDWVERQGRIDPNAELAER